MWFVQVFDEVRLERVFDTATGGSDTPLPPRFEQTYVEQVFESAMLPLFEHVFYYDTRRIESPGLGRWVRTCVRVTVCYRCIDT
mgnify:CR=1 FL=1